MIIKLTRGYEAVVDDADAELVSRHRWHAKPDRLRADGTVAVYAQTNVTGKTLTLHRYLLNAKPGEVVDHRDNDTLNYRRGNLRLVTHSGNARNRRPRGVVGIMGVTTSGRKWKASAVSPDGQPLYLGSFASVRLAGLAYDRYCRENNVEGAKLNFPEVTDYADVARLPPKTKLTAAGVLDIRKRYPAETLQQLADVYGLTKTNVSFIINYKTWKHI